MHSYGQKIFRFDSKTSLSLAFKLAKQNGSKNSLTEAKKQREQSGCTDFSAQILSCVLEHHKAYIFSQKAGLCPCDRNKFQQHDFLSAEAYLSTNSVSLTTDTDRLRTSKEFDPMSKSAQIMTPIRTNVISHLPSLVFQNETHQLQVPTCSDHQQLQDRFSTKGEGRRSAEGTNSAE
jgi:hypothetical protein